MEMLEGGLSVLSLDEHSRHSQSAKQLCSMPATAMRVAMVNFMMREERWPVRFCFVLPTETRCGLGAVGSYSPRLQCWQRPPSTSADGDMQANCTHWEALHKIFLMTSEAKSSLYDEMVVLAKDA